MDGWPSGSSEVCNGIEKHNRYCGDFFSSKVGEKEFNHRICDCDEPFIVGIKVS